MTHVLNFGNHKGQAISIFRLDEVLRQRHPVGFLRDKGEMPEWLKSHADHESVYELWVGERLRSRWSFSEITGRFKRLGLD